MLFCSGYLFKPLWFGKTTWIRMTLPYLLFKCMCYICALKKNHNTGNYEVLTASFTQPGGIPTTSLAILVLMAKIMQIIHMSACLSSCLSLSYPKG